MRHQLVAAGDRRLTVGGAALRRSVPSGGLPALATPGGPVLEGFRGTAARLPAGLLDGGADRPRAVHDWRRPGHGHLDHVGVAGEHAQATTPHTGALRHPVGNGEVTPRRWRAATSSRFAPRSAKDWGGELGHTRQRLDVACLGRCFASTGRRADAHRGEGRTVVTGVERDPVRARRRTTSAGLPGRSGFS
jgi:hypothetical protein